MKMGDKLKVCISVDEETLLSIREGVRSGRFRNRSHAFEEAIRALKQPSAQPHKAAPQHSEVRE